MATILCVLYDDPVDGYPSSYPRDDVPAIESYFGGQTTPTPEAIDFTPGELLGSVAGELGLRRFVEERGHRLIVTHALHVVGRRAPRVLTALNRLDSARSRRRS